MKNENKDGRGPDGKFKPGNSGGPGRPARYVEREYLEIVFTECPVDTWRQIIRQAVTDAREGDDKARKWLAGYLIGPPEKSMLTNAIDREKTNAMFDIFTDTV